MVGTDFGQILRRGRFIDNIKPYNIVKRKDGYSSNIHHITSRVTCVEFSFFLPQYFLAGYENGMFALFLKGYEDPIINFKHYTNSSIVDIKWSAVHPSVFFVLTSDDDLMVFDLIQNDKLIFCEKVTLKSQSKDKINRVSCKLGLICLSQKEKVQSVLVHHQPDLMKALNKNDRVAIGYSEGRVDLHWVDLSSKITDLESAISTVSKEIKAFMC